MHDRLTQLEHQFVQAGIPYELPLTNHQHAAVVYVSMAEYVRALEDPVAIVDLCDPAISAELTNAEAVVRYVSANLRIGHRAVTVVVQPASTSSDSLPGTRWCLVGQKELASLLDSAGILGIKQLLTARLGLSFLSPYDSRRSARSRMFFGRRNEINDLCSERIAIVVGPKRGGKTSLAKRVTSLLKDDPEFRSTIGADPSRERYLSRVAYVDLAEPVSIESVWRRVWQEMGVEQRDTVGGMLHRFAKPGSKATTSRTDWEVLHALLTSQYKKAVLLFDECDDAIAADEKLGFPVFQKLRSLADNDNSNTRILLFGYDKLYRASRSTAFPLFGRFHEVRVANLDHPSVQALIAEPFHELGIEFADISECAKRIYTATGGMPNLVQDVCRDLVAWLEKVNVRTLSSHNVDEVLHVQRRSLLRQIYLAFQELDDSVARLVAYLSVDTEEIRMIPTLNRLHAECGLELTDRRVRAALDYLFLHNVFHEVEQDHSYTFASSLLRHRLRGEIQEAGFGKIRDSLIGQIKESR